MTDTVIIDATCYWTFLQHKSQKSDKFQVDAGKLSTKDKDALASLGADSNVLTKELQGDYITLKSTFPIFFNDADGEPMTADQMRNVGNGTTVKMKIGTYSNQKGTWLKLMKARVVSLVQYEADDGLGSCSAFGPSGGSNDSEDVAAPDYSDLDDELPFGNEEE